MAKERACRVCGRTEAETGYLSQRSLCADCGVKRALDAARQLHDHRGAMFDRWRRNLAASVGADLGVDSRHE